jgi:hypothetical protein
MDPKIAAMQDKFGSLEGYGFYFKMLEIVGEQVDETGRCSAQYSAKTWARLAGVTAERWLRLAYGAAKLELFTIKEAGTDLLVEIPNLLKYRDNHTTNRASACKREEADLHLIRTEQNRIDNTTAQAVGETDIKKKKGKQKNATSPEFEEDWQVIRTVRGETNQRCSKSESWRMYSAALDAGVRRETIIAWWKSLWETASTEPQYWPTFQVKAKALDLLDWQARQDAGQGDTAGTPRKAYTQEQLADVLAKTQKGGAQ